MRTSRLQSFLDQFAFVPENTLKIGVENEYFLGDKQGHIVPQAKRVLDSLQDYNQLLQDSSGSLPYSYELSACQIEVRTRPVEIANLESELNRLIHPLDSVLGSLQLQRLCGEVAPSDMPLDVYPDPIGRYAEITAQMTKETLLAACRVIGTHIHVGMPNHATALKVYNQVIGACTKLCHEGDHSNGERLAVYRVVASDYWPSRYESWTTFYDTAVQKGFDHDPRQCWTFVRITKHGTIEFRMFGATKDQAEVISWAQRCHKLCAQAMLCITE